MKAFFKKFSLSNNLEAFSDTVKRFPLSSLCGALAFISALLVIHNDDLVKDMAVYDGWLLDDENLRRLILTFVLGFLWFGIVQIYVEAKKLDLVKHVALALVGFIPLLFITFGATDGFFRLFFIVPAFLLLIMVAPYILRRDSDESFWVFNRHVWFGVAVAYVASLLLAGGAAAALAAIKYLFDVKIPEEIFGDIFSFCGLILGPIYALSFIPEKFEFKDTECDTPPQVGFIVNWIFAPLVITYMAILYAYLIKIGVAWEIPKGQLSYMIVGFLGAGLVTYMVSWPLHGKGGKALSLITKYFFPAMIIPVVMQAVSIGMRIEQYGVTERRYALAMSALWFAFIAGGFLMKKLQLKHIPLSLAVLLLIASVGPWSARDVSEWSQVGRLEKVLIENNLLKDGKLIAVKEGEKLPHDVHVKVSGVADYVFQHKHKFYGHESKYEFFKALGVEHLSKWNRTRDVAVKENGNFHYNFMSRNMHQDAVNVRGADFYVPNIYWYQKTSLHGGAPERKINLAQGETFSTGEIIDRVVSINFSKGNSIKLNLDADVRRLVKEHTETSKVSEVLDVSGKNTHYVVRMRVYNLTGKIRDGVPNITNVSGALFITKR